MDTLYWYHLPFHTDLFSDGYIGVTNDLGRRDRAHRNENRKENPHLYRALKKYGDEIVLDVLMEDTEADCLDMENFFRPRRNVGWNVAIGGGKPPVRYGEENNLFGVRRYGEENPFYGQKHDDETKSVMKAKRALQIFTDEHKANIGKGLKGKPKSEEHKLNSGKAVALAYKLKPRGPMSEEHKEIRRLAAKNSILVQSNLKKLNQNKIQISDF